MTATHTFSDVINDQTNTLFDADADIQTLGDAPYDEVVTDGSGLFAFETLVSNFLAAGGKRRQRLCTKLVNRLRRLDRSPNEVIWVLHLILTSGKPGRVDDCVGILERLGHTFGKMIFVDSLVDFPLQVDGSNWLADYWYCLVRAMGRFALQEHSTLIWIVLDCASRHPLPSMREAAIEAFGEVGDERSMRRLNEIAHNDKMPAMRNFAREILNEICE